MENLTKSIPTKVIKDAPIQIVEVSKPAYKSKKVWFVLLSVLAYVGMSAAGFESEKAWDTSLLVLSYVAVEGGRDIMGTLGKYFGRK